MLERSRGPQPDFVLHPSAGARWWQFLHDHQQAARDLFDRLFAGRLHCTALEGLPFHVLEALTSEAEQHRFSPSAAHVLVPDVIQRFQALVAVGAVELIPQFPLSVEAFAVAREYRIRFYDATHVMHAAISELPLLVASQPLRDQLAVIQTDLPRLQVLWLPDYQGR
jgi:predicted nucleic acid-binding protein